jgi:homocysteine S-methyltransferase
MGTLLHGVLMSRAVWLWCPVQVVFLDGGLATELEARDMNLNDPLWSAKCLLEDPGIIRDVHCDYFSAGAEIAITATYQVYRFLQG